MQDALGGTITHSTEPMIVQVKTTPILSLSERLQGQMSKPDDRKAAPTQDPPSPPGMGDNDKVRPRDQRFAPKKRDLLSQYSHHTGPVVTLIICIIPCRITQHQLVEVINVMGFNAKYDFLYLPTGGRSSTVGSSNLGYGFINFTDPSDADPFTQCFTNYQFEGTSSTKVCTVRPAHIQGLENNILHFDRTAAKGRPRREGPFIRLPKKGRCLEAAIKSFAEELSSCGMQDAAGWKLRTLTSWRTHPSTLGVHRGSLESCSHCYARNATSSAATCIKKKFSLGASL